MEKNLFDYLKLIWNQFVKFAANQVNFVQMVGGVRCVMIEIKKVRKIKNDRIY